VPSGNKTACCLCYIFVEMFQDLDYDSENSSCFESNGEHEGKTSQDESRYIVHLDVDCFYCQCEEIANPSLATRPIAVGQKHIIVTSNYVAREMGVKKLQGRDDAMRACPSLLIIEGSDIEPYRDASRSIYDAFRGAVKVLHSDNSTRKGGMDEFFADITSAVEEEWEKEEIDRRYLRTTQNGIWVYGDDAESCVVQITEDQSGATATSTWKQGGNFGMDGGKQKMCTYKLRIAALIAKRIQQKVRAETNFSTTVGTSVSPMLAKIASDLKKPNSCNILFPWRSRTIIDTMPLRRIPDLGSRTLRSIIPILKKYNRDQDPEFWTCAHLLNVPRHALHSCLERDKDGSLCDLLINRCKGVDTLAIIDDGGGINKQVSVEDSFIRGSLTSMDGVIQNLNLLFVRILRLLDKRKKSSQKPHEAYPRVLRLTARIVDRSVTSRRPFRNISKQAAINGNLLMEMQDREERIDFLKKHTIPLLNILQNVTDGLNVTRLNLASASFADIGLSSSSDQSVARTTQKNVSSFFQCQQSTPLLNAQGSVSKTEEYDQNHCRESNGSNHTKDVLPNPTRMQDVIENLKRKQHRKRKSHVSQSKRWKSSGSNDEEVPCEPLSSGVDPSFLDAIPADIAREILENRKLQENSSPQLPRKLGIQSYFTRL